MAFTRTPGVEQDLMPAETDKYAQTTPLATGNTESLFRRVLVKRKPFLLVYHKDRVETVHIPTGGEVVVGREAPADFVLADASLSRKHARFTQSEDAIFVEDLGSTNGTRIGNRRVTREALRPGDAVTLGTITIGVHVLPSAHTSFLNLEDHDSLRSALEVEMERARFFNRPLALITVRSREGRAGHILRWSPRARGLLRPVDRMGLYSSDTVEILLPEMDRAQAVSLATTIVAGVEGEPLLGAGIACFPGAGSADALLEQSRAEALLSDAENPVRVAEAERPREWLPDAEDGDRDLIAKSPQFKAAVELSRRAARAVVPVLLQGETGTGKEVLARLIHESGPRRERPMVSVNCGALPAQLVESILFGHERGAFTGAVQQQRGVFEAADGGTVFLDEVGELPAAAQAALLRVLETKRINRIGSTREIEVDTRIIAATHRDLEAMVSAGSFREDLYYRLCVMTLEIPPLRDRREDIPFLARRFVHLAASANRSSVRAIRPEVMEVFEHYSWPGNVRELRNAIERAVVIAEEDTISLNDLSERLRRIAFASKTAPPPQILEVGCPPQLAVPAVPAVPTVDPGDDWTGGLRGHMDKLEAALLLKALREARGSQVEAARLLDIPLRTLQHRLKAHGIRKASYEGPPTKT